MVYDAHEIRGYMVARDPSPPFANQFLRKERHLVRDVDAPITVNEPLKAYFERLTQTPITWVLKEDLLHPIPLITRLQPPQDEKKDLHSLKRDACRESRGYPIIRNQPLFILREYKIRQPTTSLVSVSLPTRLGPLERMAPMNRGLTPWPPARTNRVRPPLIY